MRILVADDEPFVLDLIAMVLKDAGHSVQGVGDGRQALSLLRKEAFDLLITDLSMPHLDGLALAKEVKSESPDVKVVLLTGYGNEGALPPNIDYLLAKPLRMEALTGLIQSVGQPVLVPDEIVTLKK